MKNSSPTDLYTIRVDLDLDLENNENRRKSSIIRDISDKLRNALHISDGYSNKRSDGNTQRWASEFQENSNLLKTVMVLRQLKISHGE